MDVALFAGGGHQLRDTDKHIIVPVTFTHSFIHLFITFLLSAYEEQYLLVFKYSAEKNGEIASLMNMNMLS